MLLSLNRAIRETVDGNIEGGYALLVDQRLRLSAPIAHSRACFYTRHDASWIYKGVASLNGTTVGVIDDYGYDGGRMDAYIAANYRQREVMELSTGETAGITNLQKLLGGRYPVMQEHEAVMARLSKRLDAAGRLHPHSASKLRSIQAVFSCTSRRVVSKSAVGWSLA